MKWLKYIWYSFPVQLFVIQLRSYSIFIFAWAIFFYFVLGHGGEKNGVPYLFLDPEYLGVVGYFSFQLVGVGLGVFVITWNIANYILHSFRYPFVASLNWPVAMFTLNNIVLPLLFLSVYIWQIIKFQREEMLQEPMQIFWSVIGLIAGFVLVILLTSIYFVVTNKNIFGFIKEEKQDFKSEIEQWRDLHDDRKLERVDYYFTKRLRFRPVRDVTHYDDKLLKKVFQQHHINALILMIITAAILIGLGFLIDNPLFEIPAACSMFLFVSVIISLAGFLYYWSGQWATFAILVFVFSLNYLTGLDFLNYKNQAYGINYEAGYATYHLDTLKQIASVENIESDKAETINILNNWKKKNTTSNYEKPKMIVVVSSGGGAKTATFTMKILQTADSLSQGELMKKTVLMTGASGGMLGLGYFRELYLRKNLGIVEDFYSSKYPRNISKDVLNKIWMSVVTNDLYYPFQSRKIGDYSYVLDRGMMMELAFNRNTEEILDKPLSDYKDFEKKAAIPMLFSSASNLADSRKIIISPLRISYMMRSYTPLDTSVYYEIDAIDFGRFFEKNDAYNIRFSSVMRMNASYPIIMPAVSLPSQPQMDVIDAGLRDNYGMENAIRFLNVFQNWINKNTSGVTIVQIRGTAKDNAIEDFEYKTFLSKILSPFGNLFSNLTVNQDYYHDYMIAGLAKDLNNKLEIIRFEINNDALENKISMSFRLTEREVEYVLSAVDEPENENSMNRLLDVLEK